MSASAAEAIEDHGACPSCTTEGAIFWHTPAVCRRDWRHEPETDTPAIPLF